MTAPTPLVVLTGATGFIGFRILIELLQRGYRVRAVVRSVPKGQWLASRLSKVLQGMEFEHLVSFSIVGDFEPEGAFDQALQGASYVIHVAAPISSSPHPDHWERDFKHAVVRSQIGLLESARRSASVKRVVITSSISAIFETNVFERGSDELLHADMRIPEMRPPYRHQMLAYQAGKIASLRASQEWMSSEQPAFDAIYLYPAFTLGRNDVCETKQDLLKFSSNWHCLQILLGHQSPRAKPLLTCHIQDVAHCHVQALSGKVAGNQSFLIASHEPGLEWDVAKDFVQKRYPEAVRSGIIPNNGHMPTSKVSIDVAKTEKVFDFKHSPYEAQVDDLVKQYLELHEREGAVNASKTNESKTDEV